MRTTDASSDDVEAFDDLPKGNPATIPSYLPLSPRLDFYFVVALVRGLEMAQLRGAGLVVPSDLAGAMTWFPASVLVESARFYGIISEAFPVHLSF